MVIWGDRAKRGALPPHTVLAGTAVIWELDWSGTAKVAHSEGWQVVLLSLGVQLEEDVSWGAVVTYRAHCPRRVSFSEHGAWVLDGRSGGKR